MNKPRTALATSAMFLSAALVASYLQLQKPAIKATEVLTWITNNVENYVDDNMRVFKLDLVLDSIDSIVLKSLLTHP